MNNKVKNLLFFILKLSIGISILLILIWKVQRDQGAMWAVEHDGENIWIGMFRLILKSRLQLIILAIFANAFALLQVAFRWHDLLTCHGSKMKLFNTIKILAVSYLYNNLLPASIGMDAVRIAYSYSFIRKKSEVVSSVLADRLLGFVGMLILGVVCVPFYWNAPYGKIIFSIEILSLIFLFLFLWIFSHRALQSFYIKNIKRLKLFKLGDKLSEFYQALRSYADKPRTVIRVIIFSILLQFFLTINMYLLARALFIDNISLGILLGYLPIINIIAMIPTPGGLGPREASVVFLFGKAGVLAPYAFTLSLMYYLIGLFVSLTGIIFMPLLKFSKGEENV